MEIVFGAVEPRRWADGEVGEQLGLQTSHIRRIVNRNRQQFERFGFVLKSLSGETYWLNYDHVLTFCQFTDIVTPEIRTILDQIVDRAVAILKGADDSTSLDEHIRKDLERVFPSALPPY